MRVLLTGGTGFVGAWTARAVQDAGHQVRFLVRDPARLTTSAATLGVETGDHVRGDITDPASVRTALAGCDAVVHCAAVVLVGRPGDHAAERRMAETNLDGARHVLGQAVELGLDPVVHVSSVAALFRPGLTDLHPDLPVTAGLDAYGASKAAVEAYARSLQDEGAPVVTTYPGMVLGPPAGDQGGEATDGVRAAVRLRLIPGSTATWSVCDVRDLGRVHAALLRPGLGPRRYVAGGIRIGVPEIVALLSAASGRRLVRVPLPDPALRALGRGLDRARVPGKITGPAMEYYTRMPRCDNDPLERDLGVTFRDPQETLRDAVSGLRALGRL